LPKKADLSRFTQVYFCDPQSPLVFSFEPRCQKHWLALGLDVSKASDGQILISRVVSMGQCNRSEQSKGAM
jgi:hypothetical protein